MFAIGACYSAEIRHGAGVPPQDGYSEYLCRPDLTSWAGEAKECFWRSVQPEPGLFEKT